MDLNAMINGYQFANGGSVLESYHHHCVEKITKRHYEEIKIGNLNDFGTDLMKLSRIYQQKIMADNNLKSIYKSVVIVWTKKRVLDFISYYHNTLFIILAENKAIQDYNYYINSDCDTLFYPVEPMINQQKDGWFSYILHDLISVSNNINVLTDSSNYFKGLVGCLEHYNIDTNCNIFSDNVNKVINKIRLEQFYPKTIGHLEEYIKNEVNDINDTINELFTIGYCYYNYKNEINYLKELI